MKRHLKIYLHILAFSLKTLLEYRWNALVQSIYVPAYVAILLLVLEIVYSKTPILGGWNLNEALLLFGVFHTMYGIFMFSFIDGMRRLMSTGITQGDVDMVLTKPVNSQFLLLFSHPDVFVVFDEILVLLFFIHQLFVMRGAITLNNFLLFLFMFFISMSISYFIFSSYATISFYIHRARQIMEFLDKSADFSQYPNHIFPPFIQFFSFTFVPIAFFSYVPTLFLLGKGTWQIFVFSIGMFLLSFAINKMLWKISLRRYSSASS